MAALDDFVVVEQAGGLVGGLAGLHLSLLGADVWKVEPPGGDRIRSWGGGATFAALSVGQRLVVEGDPGALSDRLGSMLAAADIAIVDDGPAADLAREIAHRGGRLRSVVVVASDDVPGSTGAEETVTQAALAFTPYLGTAGEPPERIGADLASTTAGTMAVQAALAGLIAEAIPLVSTVSRARALATMKTIHLAGRSDPSEWDGYHVTADDRAPDRGYLAADGRLSFEFPPNVRDGWRSFCEWLGLDQFADEVGDDWYETTGMGERSEWARPRYEEALATVARDDAVAAARERGGWAVPFLSVDEALAHPQVREHGAITVDGVAVTINPPWQGEHLTTGSRAVAPAGPPGRDNETIEGMSS